MRGLENTRIESLSDGVFAIAIGLLLITSEVPQTFDQLRLFLQEFVPFFATIGLLMVIWYQHYIFFIRYGLKDATITALNTVFLVLVLFYVYPLKFLFQVLYHMLNFWISGKQAAFRDLFREKLPIGEADQLMVIYGLGAAGIFLVLALFYTYANRKRSMLRLNRLEMFDTRASIRMNLLMAAIPMLSALLALSGFGGRQNFMFSGIVYWLYPVVMPLHGLWIGRQRKRLLRAR